MKRTTLLCSAGTLLLSTLSLHVSADEQFFPGNDTVGTQLCMAITTNSPLKLRRALSDTGARINVVKNDLHCNSLSVREFASLYGFDKSLRTLKVEPLTQTSIYDLAKVHGDKLQTVVGS